MKGAFLTERGILKVMEMPSPSLKRGGLLIAMKMAAICRTDLKMVQAGHKDLVLPRILGHEGVGEIVESDDPMLKEGETVVIYPGCYCGECPACRSGHTARCEKIRIFGFNEDGFFRTFVPFSKEEVGCMVRLPSQSYPETIVLTEPLACCISAIRKFRFARKKNALIVGAGAIGSIFAALLVSQGWEHVIVADKENKRLLKELPEGVETLHVSTDKLLSAFKKNGRGQTIDFIAPCCPGGLNWPFWEVMRPGGSVSFFSGGMEGGPVSMDMNTVHYRELAFVGSYGCNKEDFVTASMMLTDGRIDLSFFDFYRLGIDRISYGMECLEQKKIKKVMINRF